MDSQFFLGDSLPNNTLDMDIIYGQSKTMIQPYALVDCHWFRIRVLPENLESKLMLGDFIFVSEDTLVN